MDWFHEWMGEWTVESTYGGSASSFARRFGKVLSPSDMTFSHPDVLTTGEILPRTGGDFVMASIPDTACPPLDEIRPEFSSIESVERFRWNYSGDLHMKRGWRIWHHNGVVQLRHLCYPGDFVMEVSSVPLTKGGSYLRSGSARSFDGVCAVIDAWSRLNIAGVGYMEHCQARQEWQGRFSGRAYLFMVTSSPSPVLLEMIPIPDNQRDIRYRIERFGSQLRFWWLDSGGEFQSTSVVPAGGGRIVLKFEGVQVHTAC